MFEELGFKVYERIEQSFIRGNDVTNEIGAPTQRRVTFKEINEGLTKAFYRLKDGVAKLP